MHSTCSSIDVNVEARNNIIVVVWYRLSHDADARQVSEAGLRLQLEEFSVLIPM